MEKCKYIVTIDLKVIVFGPTFQHIEFKHLDPISAGFIQFFTNKMGNPACKCYGESISLNLKSDSNDTNLAMIQILNYDLDMM